MTTTMNLIQSNQNLLMKLTTMTNKTKMKYNLKVKTKIVLTKMMTNTAVKEQSQHFGDQIRQPNRQKD